MGSISKITNSISKCYVDICTRFIFCPSRFQRLVLGAFGMFLIMSAFAGNAYAGGGTFGIACSKMLLLVEGAFGAMVAAVAGVAAILAAALGGFKMAWSLVVVSIGAFILRSWILLFQGSCGCPTC